MGSEMCIRDSPKLNPEADLRIASEIVDHVFAGFDTGSITMLFLASQLSKPENEGWQEKVRHGGLSLMGDITARSMDSLPILNAVIMETLRLYPPGSGNQVCISPSKRNASSTCPALKSSSSQLVCEYTHRLGHSIVILLSSQSLIRGSQIDG